MTRCVDCDAPAEVREVVRDESRCLPCYVVWVKPVDLATFALGAK